MSELIDKLRDGEAPLHICRCRMYHAADTIERLEREIKAEREISVSCARAMDAAEARAERYRKAIVSAELNTSLPTYSSSQEGDACRTANKILRDALGEGE